MESAWFEHASRPRAGQARLGLPALDAAARRRSARRCAAPRGRRRGWRSRRTSPRRRTGPPACPHRPPRLTLQVQLVHARLGVARPAPARRRRAPPAVARRGPAARAARSRGSRRPAAPPRPPTAADPAARPRSRAEHPGHDLDVPHAPRTRVRTRPRWRATAAATRRAVQPDPRSDVLGGAQVPSGLGAFPPEQIGQRGRAGAVAALAERAASFEIGERGHTGLIEGATHALAEGQHPEQIGLARRLARGIPQHLDRLAEQAARDFQRAFRHLSIVPEHMFDQVLLSADVYGDAASSCTVSRGIGTAKTSATTWLQPCTK